MDKDLLAHLPVVLTVARRGGFASAAAALNMSPSAVSHAVRAVEDRLGQPLFVRTTRSVALTEAGAAFVASVGPGFGQTVEESVERVRSAKGRVAGVLRLNTPRLALPLAITPAVVAMSRLYPDLTIEITSVERLVDIVAEGFDAGVRLGEMIAQDMIAVRLTPPFQAITGAPSYLADRGVPDSIADLADHNCIGYRLIASDAAYAWDLQENGRELSVVVSGSIRVTDSLYARELALQGVGIAYLFEPLVREDLRAGRLRRVLPAASIEEPGLFLYFPRYLSEVPKLRAFIDTLRQTSRMASASSAARDMNREDGLTN